MCDIRDRHIIKKLKSIKPGTGPSRKAIAIKRSKSTQTKKKPAGAFDWLMRQLGMKTRTEAVKKATGGAIKSDVEKRKGKK